MPKKLLSNTDGTTVVSIIVAFAILMIGISMMTTAIMTGSNVANEALEIRENTDKAVGEYYKATSPPKTANDNVTFTIQTEAGSPVTAFSQFKGKHNVYSYPASAGDDGFVLYNFESIN